MRLALAMLATLAALGCAGRQRANSDGIVATPAPLRRLPEVEQEVMLTSAMLPSGLAVAQAPDETNSAELPPPVATAIEFPAEVVPPEVVPPSAPTADGAGAAQVDCPPVELAAVIQSVRLHFPLVQSALAARDIAAGQSIEAAGGFDHKFKATSENGVLGYYETYRHATGIERYTMGGGQVFAGYRVGRGSFEPWYLERQTNDGGEFKAGFLTPLAQDRWIDPRRAELWRAQIEQDRVEPEIRAALIGFTRDASLAYWQWVAAGESFRVNDQLLRIAQTRNENLRIQIDKGDKAPIEQVDNERLLLEREAKTIDARRKLEQTAIKLSLFYRGNDGAPCVPLVEQLPGRFPEILEIDDSGLSDDVSFALGNRPELLELSLIRRQLAIDLAQARNLARPQVNTGLIAGQDVGEPTSSKRDKSQLELEAGVYVEVPLERRKALGKQRQVQGKLAQVRAKQQFTNEKIIAEVGLVRAALVAAYERVERATAGLQLAERMQQAEQTLYEKGTSDLFLLNAREKQTAEAAVLLVETRLEYFEAVAQYEAILAANVESLPANANPNAE